MKKNIVNTLVGNEIREIRVMSFLIDSKLICEVIALYIRMEDERWYRFTSSDGVSSIEVLSEEPGLISLDSIGDNFAYPVKVMTNNYVHCRIIDVKEYLWLGKEDESAGFYVALEVDRGFSLFDDNDCLRFTEGIRLDQGYTLVSCC